MPSQIGVDDAERARSVANEFCRTLRDARAPRATIDVVDVVGISPLGVPELAVAVTASLIDGLVARAVIGSASSRFLAVHRPSSPFIALNLEHPLLHPRSC